MSHSHKSHPTLTVMALDNQGFLINSMQWSVGIAEQIAHHEGMPRLTEEQWEVISCVREYYLEHTFFPVLHHVCWLKHKPPHTVEKLFDGHQIRVLKIAGLPNPGEEMISYLS